MIKALILYTQFFTRIPIPIGIDEPIEKMRHGIHWFTLFGFLIGGLEALIYYGLSFLFPVPLAFFIILLVDAMITGGFHLDALADMADGLFSSRKKERMLEIMKDSRIGSNGVLALIFYYGTLLLIVQSFAQIITPKLGVLLVISFSLIGKTGISLLFYKMKYAGSTQGLGTTFLNVPTVCVLGAQLFSIVILYVFFGLAGLLGYLGVFLVGLLYKRMVYQKVAGLNGDTLGAYGCISQVVFLAIYFATRGFLT
ncbi:adenosylcobinamide-GDP ribazoletransferase [Vagococcus intermedius]|uniref:Adenosylcobinamide-GDP ribazoletransferase n=1 Tax=Vagococcus intermedius TaxID=2991418 RepID=A0AAF0I728_9ENTE|nr:adenosylcobinamide-GDP ribazoletransferase [Vagococcus intermedius]WEG72721.1 adenosylcobinamide-GDP ribazoletransferase [Vagococcus intermedius]WEG74807.1 adenosylcobinamide-GDP ribazoletransferase [Vagococcus intermedius]